MASRRKLRLALLGAGKMGSIHAQMASDAAGVVLDYVQDPDRAARASVAARTGARTASAADIFADPSVDAVIIAASATEHAQLALAAIRAGKAALCEKPLATSLTACRKIAAASCAAKVPVMTAFNRRFDALHRKLRDDIRRGRIGKLEVMRFTSRSASPPSVAKAKVSGGMLREKGTHFYDLACWLSGQLPVSVFAVGDCMIDNALARVGDIDTALLVMKLDGGALCQFDFSRRGPYGHDERIEALGSAGVAQIGCDSPDGAVLRRAGQTITTTDRSLANWDDRYLASYRDELNAFVRAVAGGRAMPVPVAAGVCAEAVASAALRSLRSGRAVPVDYP